MRDEHDALGDDAKAALASVFSEFGGESLRDVWLFDRSAFVTRDTYDQLYHASYRYTARGFDDFEQFRTFFEADGTRLGVFAGFDQRDGGYEYAALDDRVQETASEYEFRPVGSGE